MKAILMVIRNILREELIWNDISEIRNDAAMMYMAVLIFLLAKDLT